VRNLKSGTKNRTKLGITLKQSAREILAHVKDWTGCRRELSAGKVASEPQLALETGLKTLDDLMRTHGFVYTPTAAGESSGGQYASGEFRRGARSLELHYRHSLGLVTYCVGGMVLSHEDYMWSVLGRRRASQYPGFSRESSDGFLHLLADLRNDSVDFLAGPDAEFAANVERVNTLKQTATRLP
jgi:hypothetical protein